MSKSVKESVAYDSRISTKLNVRIEIGKTRRLVNATLNIRIIEL